MTTPMTTDDILALAGDSLVRWSVCWKALGPPSEERDSAWAECERAHRKQYGDRHCAAAIE